MSQEAEDQLAREQEKELMEIENADAAIAKQQALDDAARGTVVSDLQEIDKIIEDADSEELDPAFLEDVTENTDDEEDIDLDLDSDDYDEDDEDDLENTDDPIIP